MASDSGLAVLPVAGGFWEELLEYFDRLPRLLQLELNRIPLRLSVLWFHPISSLQPLLELPDDNLLSANLGPDGCEVLLDSRLPYSAGQKPKRQSRPSSIQPPQSRVKSRIDLSFLIFIVRRTLGSSFRLLSNGKRRVAPANHPPFPPCACFVNDSHSLPLLSLLRRLTALRHRRRSCRSFLEPAAQLAHVAPKNASAAAG